MEIVIAAAVLAVGLVVAALLLVRRAAGLVPAGPAAAASLAARQETFGCGWLEALTHLEREPDRPVLYVMADVELAPSFAALVEEPEASYAVAFLLARDGADGEALQLDLVGDDEAPNPPWPHAAEFLRGWLGGASEFALGRFRWRRVAGAAP
jgi:hypothetical protein